MSLHQPATRSTILGDSPRRLVLAIVNVVDTPAGAGNGHTLPHHKEATALVKCHSVFPDIVMISFAAQ